MDKDINEHIKACHQCQLRKTNHRPPPILLTALPQPTEPNMRVHADLHWPLKTSGNNKKYILVTTDTFTKYIEIGNKEAETKKLKQSPRQSSRNGSVDTESL